MKPLSYKTKRRLSAFLLIIGLPLYIIIAVSILALFERPSLLLEFAIYVSLGVLWALPFKAIFKGVGQSNPDAPKRIFDDDAL